MKQKKYFLSKGLYLLFETPTCYEHSNAVSSDKAPSKMINAALSEKSIVRQKGLAGVTYP